MAIKELYVTSVELPKYHCAICGHHLDRVLSIRRGKELILPKAGNLTLCVMCGGVNVFKEDGTLRVATSTECERLPEWVKHFIADTFTNRERQ